MALPLTTRSMPRHPHAKWAGHSRTRFWPIPPFKGTWFRPITAIPTSSSSVTASSLFHSLPSNKAISPFMHTSPVYTLEKPHCVNEQPSLSQPLRKAAGRTTRAPTVAPQLEQMGILPRRLLQQATYAELLGVFRKGQRDIATTP